MTLGKARARLADTFFPGDRTTPAFAEVVTEVLERLHNVDLWPGARATFRTEVPESGILFLPLWLRSVLAARVNDVRTRVYSSRFEFVCDGPGELKSDKGYQGLMVDKGESGIEAVFPSTPGTITVKSSVEDDPVEVRLLGTNADDAPLASASSAGHVLVVDEELANVKSIHGIQKDLSRGIVSVWYNYGEADALLLATIPPGVTTPLYRRYQVSATPGLDMFLFCERRPLPVYREEDYLLPDDIGALRNSLHALRYEERGDLKAAVEHWNMATTILKAQARLVQIGNTEVEAFEPWGHGVPSVPTLY